MSLYIKLSKELNHKNKRAKDITELNFSFFWWNLNERSSWQSKKDSACKHPGHNYKDQASSFAAIKACYPFTIKGEPFSLLCYQPQAFPASLKTLTLVATDKCQYLPQIWNGQAKAQLLIRFILGHFSHTQSATCRSYRATSDSQAMLITYRHAYINSANYLAYRNYNGSH